MLLYNCGLCNKFVVSEVFYTAFATVNFSIMHIQFLLLRFTCILPAMISWLPSISWFDVFHQTNCSYRKVSLSERLFWYTSNSIIFIINDNRKNTRGAEKTSVCPHVEPLNWSKKRYGELPNTESHNFYFSCNIARVMKQGGWDEQNM